MLSRDSEDKMGCDLCLNLQYDFVKMNSTLGSVVPLAMFVIQITTYCQIIGFLDNKPHQTLSQVWCLWPTSWEIYFSRVELDPATFTPA